MIFVTGASGLVGSHLIQSLVAKGKAVRALYRNQIPSFKGAEKVNWVAGDLLDVSALTDAMEGATHVYHSAAIVSFSPSKAAMMIKANQEGTANLVNICLDQKVEKLVFVSSVAALGRIREDAPIDETMNLTPETSNIIFGKSKSLA